jgi:hypothetical protein
MKQVLGVLLALAVGFGSLWANAFSRTVPAGELSVTYSSAKPIARGENHIAVQVRQGEVEIKDAKVTFVAFMPEMPGMHYMEEKVEAPYLNGAYQANVFLSMNGTWQIHIFIETADGKKQRARSSVTL